MLLTERRMPKGSYCSQGVVYHRTTTSDALLDGAGADLVGVDL